MQNERNAANSNGEGTGFSPDDLLFSADKYDLMLNDIRVLERTAIDITSNPQSNLLYSYEKKSAAIYLLEREYFLLVKSVLHALRRQRFAQDMYRAIDSELAKLEATPMSPTIEATAAVDEQRSELLKLRAAQKDEYCFSKLEGIGFTFRLQRQIAPSLMNSCLLRLGVRDDSIFMFTSENRFLVPDPERDAQEKPSLGKQVFVISSELKELLEDGKPADERKFKELMDKFPASLLAKTYQNEKAKTWGLVHKLRLKNTVGTAKELVALKMHVSLALVQKQWDAYNAKRK